MIIVSDTSPLTSLAAIGRFDLLKALFGEVHIPEAVWDELNAGGRSWPGANEVGSASWIHRHSVQNRAFFKALLRELDPGESEGIALAVELGADLVLIGERDGRRVAQEMGLNVAGLVAVLVEARKAGLIEDLRNEIEALKERAGFRLSADVVQRALAAAGEGLSDTLLEIILTEGNIKNSSLPVLGVRPGFFPASAYGGPNRTVEGVPIEVRFEPGPTVSTDIATDKMILRNREGVKDFFAASGAKAGDGVLITRLSEGRFLVKLATAVPDRRLRTPSV